MLYGSRRKTCFRHVSASRYRLVAQYWLQRNALMLTSSLPIWSAVYARQRRYTDSIREYETALQIGSDDINIRAFLCNQYWATNRYRDADTCLKRVLRLDPYNKSALKIYPYVTKSLEHGEHER